MIELGRRLFAASGGGVARADAVQGASSRRLELASLARFSFLAVSLSRSHGVLHLCGNLSDAGASIKMEERCGSGCSRWWSFMRT